MYCVFRPDTVNYKFLSFFLYYLFIFFSVLQKNLQNLLTKKLKIQYTKYTRIECYHHGADCLKSIHSYYLNTLGGPLQLVVVLVFLFFSFSRGLLTGKFLSMSFRNYFPRLVVSEAHCSGLNQISFLLRCFLCLVLIFVRLHFL